MLLRLVESHLKETRTPPARFGREAVGDSRFVFDLRGGREPRSKTARRVLTYIEAQKRTESSPTPVSEHAAGAIDGPLNSIGHDPDCKA